MEKFTYDQFYSHVWEDSAWLEKLVSTAYLEQNDDFIRNLTFDMFNIYDKDGIGLQMAVKTFEIFFFNIFRFEADNKNVKELKDKNYNHL